VWCVHDLHVSASADLWTAVGQESSRASSRLKKGCRQNNGYKVSGTGTWLSRGQAFWRLSRVNFHQRNVCGIEHQELRLLPEWSSEFGLALLEGEQPTDI
jgi:hypothetical protein